MRRSAARRAVSWVGAVACSDCSGWFGSAGDLGAGKFPIWRVGGGLTPENMLLISNLTKKVVFLTVAGFGILLTP